jgi:hypothetical protein
VRQLDETHVCPTGHAVAQLPQCAAWVAVSTQSDPHIVMGALQVGGVSTTTSMAASTGGRCDEQAASETISAPVAMGANRWCMRRVLIG